jgi:hypothetical protein
VTRIVATEKTVAAVRDRGGSLWVWTHRAPCCGALVRLESATTPRQGREFRHIASEPFDVHLASAFAPPDELHVETGRRGRVEAYWNGCAWVT